MQIFILRHGKAKDAIPNQKDFDRPLSGKGEKQINKIGKYIADKGITQIISSSAKRTTQTTEIANTYMDVKKVSFFEDLYLTDAATIKEKIADFAEDEKVLFVGHNFGISDFVGALTDQHVTLSTGMLAIVSLDIKDWSHLTFGLGHLDDIISPKTL